MINFAKLAQVFDYVRNNPSGLTIETESKIYFKMIEIEPIALGSLLN